MSSLSSLLYSVFPPTSSFVSPLFSSSVDVSGVSSSEPISSAGSNSSSSEPSPLDVLQTATVSLSRVQHHDIFLTQFNSAYHPSLLLDYTLPSGSYLIASPKALGSGYSTASLIVPDGTDTSELKSDLVTQAQRQFNTFHTYRSPSQSFLLWPDLSPSSSTHSSSQTASSPTPASTSLPLTPTTSSPRSLISVSPASKTLPHALSNPTNPTTAPSFQPSSPLESFPQTSPSLLDRFVDVWQSGRNTPSQDNTLFPHNIPHKAPGTLPIYALNVPTIICYQSYTPSTTHLTTLLPSFLLGAGAYLFARRQVLSRFDMHQFFRRNMPHFRNESAIQQYFAAVLGMSSASAQHLRAVSALPLIEVPLFCAIASRCWGNTSSQLSATSIPMHGVAHDVNIYTKSQYKQLYSMWGGFTPAPEDELGQQLLLKQQLRSSKTTHPQQEHLNDASLLGSSPIKDFFGSPNGLSVDSSSQQSTTDSSSSTTAPPSSPLPLTTPSNTDSTPAWWVPTSSPFLFRAYWRLLRLFGLEQYSSNPNMHLDTISAPRTSPSDTTTTPSTFLDSSLQIPAISSASAALTAYRQSANIERFVIAFTVCGIVVSVLRRRSFHSQRSWLFTTFHHSPGQFNLASLLQKNTAASLDAHHQPQVSGKMSLFHWMKESIISLIGTTPRSYHRFFLSLYSSRQTAPQRAIVPHFGKNTAPVSRLTNAPVDGIASTSYSESLIDRAFAQGQAIVASELSRQNPQMLTFARIMLVLGLVVYDTLPFRTDEIITDSDGIPIVAAAAAAADTQNEPEITNTATSLTDSVDLTSDQPQAESLEIPTAPVTPTTPDDQEKPRQLHYLHHQDHVLDGILRVPMYAYLFFYSRYFVTILTTASQIVQSEPYRKLFSAAQVAYHSQHFSLAATNASLMETTTSKAVIGTQPHINQPFIHFMDRLFHYQASPNVTSTSPTPQSMEQLVHAAEQLVNATGSTKTAPLTRLLSKFSSTPHISSPLHYILPFLPSGVSSSTSSLLKSKQVQKCAAILISFTALASIFALYPTRQFIRNNNCGPHPYNEALIQASVSQPATDSNTQALLNVLRHDDVSAMLAKHPFYAVPAAASTVASTESSTISASPIPRLSTTVSSSPIETSSSLVLKSSPISSSSITGNDQYSDSIVEKSTNIDTLNSTGVQIHDKHPAGPVPSPLNDVAHELALHSTSSTNLVPVVMLQIGYISHAPLSVQAVNSVQSETKLLKQKATKWWNSLFSSSPVPPPSSSSSSSGNNGNDV